MRWSLLLLAGCRLHFDDVPPPRCLADDFGGGALDPAWTTLDPDGPTTVGVTGDALVVTLLPNQIGYNGVQRLVDVSDESTVEIDFVPTDEAGFVETAFLLGFDNDNRYLLSTGAGSFVARATFDGVVDELILPWDPVAFRRFRFHHDSTADTMALATSSDGIAWTTHKTVPSALSLTAIQLVLFAGAFGDGNATPGTATYDNLVVDGPSCQ